MGTGKNLAPREKIEKIHLVLFYGIKVLFLVINIVTQIEQYIILKEFFFFFFFEQLQ